MYQKTMHKIRKALNRVNRIRIENHFRKFVTKIVGAPYIGATTTWPGLIRPSTFRKIHKQLEKPSKYIPHQGPQECERRTNNQEI